MVLLYKFKLANDFMATIVAGKRSALAPRFMLRCYG